MSLLNMRLSSGVLACIVLALQCVGALCTQKVDCSNGYYAILETIPADLDIELVGSATHYDGWMAALNGAKQVSIASLFADLEAPPAAQNQSDSNLGHILNQTLYALAKNGTKMNMITNDCASIGMFSCAGAQQWQKDGVMEVTFSPWNKILSQSENRAIWACQHAKVISVDGRHAYSGSANLGWSSLAQTKELGLMIYDCPALAQVYQNVVEMWTIVSKKGFVPKSWPTRLVPTVTPSNPFEVSINSADGSLETLTMFPCYSPTPFNYAPGADCKDSIVAELARAEKHIVVSLMDYSASSLYQKLANNSEVFWGHFDSQLRAAAQRGVHVRLLVSNWSMTFPMEVPYWQSLAVLPNVEVRKFEMPAYGNMPGSRRVNHDKFIVTDKSAIIDTSNWSMDYYAYFGGLAWVVEGGSLGNTLMNAFDRDWKSQYVSPVVI